MVEPLLIRGARVLDPSSGMDQVGDLLIVDGQIRQAGETVRDGDVPPDCLVIPGDGLVACPGFIDLHSHLREPGFEDKETIATGSLAAARGGYTTICCMPNTNPPIDSAGTVEFIARKAREAGLVRVLPIGCVSKRREGRELAEMWELAQAGVIGFSDDGSPVGNSNLMRQALSYATGLGLPVIDHCEDVALTGGLKGGAAVNEGWVSNRLGLRGWPAPAEEDMVARDIALAEFTGGLLHLAHLSTAGSVQLVRQAKERGIRVTAEVTPHHLTLSEAWVLGHDQSGPLSGPLTVDAYDPATKVNPPLRSRKDVEAVIAGLRDGVLDAIATDHAPHTMVEKLVTSEDAEWGISVLETALGALLALVHRGEVDLMTLVTRLTTGPAAVLGDAYRDLAALRPGTTADVVLFDPNAEWVVRTAEFASKGKNSPLEGVTLRGRVVTTIAGGRPVYSALTDTHAGVVGDGR
ncbi:MAG: dihydroorotase [Chloroflexi bacterium]|nr:dihydroorotase [Chloroflexota bacterium]